MRNILLFFTLIINLPSFSQNGWSVCNAPAFQRRVDDIYMVNTQVGYAAGGDGMIVKTTDGGNNWSLIKQESNTYFRSVEFLNEQVGFAGAFPSPTNASNIIILRKTVDGGANWTDLTPQLPAKAKAGICGLDIVDANTIYGCGNWYENEGYIIKSTNGGATWSLIDMSAFSSSIIDLHFINKDTGFATGKSKFPFATGIILYTTDGGVTWTYKYSGDYGSQYCWKIQKLTPLIYYVAVEDLLNTPPKILRSLDGGMTWKILFVSTIKYNIEGVGFIDPLHGWTGGDVNKSFETKDGGVTWDSIPVCPRMNRVFRLNDTTMFASGNQIWKYNGRSLYPALPDTRFVSLNCHPNPVKGMLTIDIAISVPTHVSLLLLDGSGRTIKMIDNSDRVKGSYHFYLTTDDLPQGMYYVSLKTHEDKETQKIIVGK